jgi:hypothetical protein
MSTRALATLALLLSTRLLAAQELRGTVVDSASRAPVAGAVILLLDAGGRQIARNITNEHGAYRIALHPSMVRVRFLRIGFRPRELSIPPLIEGMAQLDVRLATLPQFLQPVVVVDQPNCPRQAGRDLAFALWEQARAGLLATVVSRESSPAAMSRIVYRRHMLDNTDRIGSQLVQRDTATSSRGFSASHSSSAFLEEGFIVPAGSGVLQYYGPDADVLLDEAFTNGYCLSIAKRDPKRPLEIGLRFSPARRRKGRVDIDGALWIDTTARALRTIEFDYLGLEQAADLFRPGGYISFREMPSGIVVVDKWWLRMTGARIDTAQAPTRHVLRLTEAGGEIAHARWPDSTGFDAPLGTLDVTTVNRRGTAMSGVRIALDSTDYEGVSDSTGALTITDLLPGPYTASIVDSTLDAIGLRLETKLSFVAARDSTVRAKILVRSATDSIQNACDATGGRNPGSFLVVARIVSDDDKPVNGAQWEIRDARGTKLLNGQTGSDGLFAYCRSLELGSRIEIRASRRRGFGRSDAHATVARTLSSPLTAIKVRLE